MVTRFHRYVYFYKCNFCRKKSLSVVARELRVKQLRRFDLPSADLDHAMIRVGELAQVVVVAE